MASSRCILRAEHWSISSYLSTLVRDLVNLIDSLLVVPPPERRGEIVATSKVDRTTNSYPPLFQMANGYDLQPNRPIQHVHRLEDGRIFYHTDDQSFWVIDPRCGQVLLTSYLRHIQYGRNNLPLIQHNHLLVFEYSFSGLPMTKLLDISEYQILALTETHLILYQSGFHYVYEIAAQTIFPLFFPRPIDREVYLNDTHLWVVRRAELVLQGINLRTRQLEFNLSLGSTPLTSKDQILVSNDHLYLLYEEGGFYRMRDLITGLKVPSVLICARNIKQLHVYSRDNQFYFACAYQEGKNTIYHFYE